MRERLVADHKKLLTKYKIDDSLMFDSITEKIRNGLVHFMEVHSNVAIWGNGVHTKMLMSDFISELRKVNIIIDSQNKNVTEESGYKFIGKSDITFCKIDGIIISSYKYRNEIKEEIKKNNSSVDYFDIYEMLSENGIVLSEEYYTSLHPYGKYQKLNKLICEYNQKSGEICFEIISELIKIHDYILARKYAEQYVKINKSKLAEQLLTDLNLIIEDEMKAMKAINDNNVLMFCVDGMRCRDSLHSELCNFLEIRNKSVCYDNARSVSSTTFESLIPVYGENNDMSTAYYKKDKLEEMECRFIRHAIKSGRAIHFYTDGIEFVSSSHIKHQKSFQTATEKLWNFIIDAVDEDNGLFYVHVLFESHFSYPSPYADDKMIATGTNMVFDVLPMNGGRVKIDYETQHDKAIQYLDDSIFSLLKCFYGRMVLYADHGGYIMQEGETIENVKSVQLFLHEDLYHIPFLITKQGVEPKTVNNLFSLMELSNVVICLMDNTDYKSNETQFVKYQRSEIYNPDYKYIYKKCGYEQGLLAFECFEFEDEYKLVVFENKVINLAFRNELIEDEEKKKIYLKKVEKLITVCK